MLHCKLSLSAVTNFKKGTPVPNFGLTIVNAASPCGARAVLGDKTIHLGHSSSFKLDTDADHYLFDQPVSAVVSYPEPIESFDEDILTNPDAGVGISAAEAYVSLEARRRAQSRKKLALERRDAARAQKRADDEAADKAAAEEAERLAAADLPSDPDAADLSEPAASNS